MALKTSNLTFSQEIDPQSLCKQWESICVQLVEFDWEIQSSWRITDADGRFGLAGSVQEWCRCPAPPLEVVSGSIQNNCYCRASIRWLRMWVDSSIWRWELILEDVNWRTGHKMNFWSFPCQIWRAANWTEWSAVGRLCQISTPSEESIFQPLSPIKFHGFKVQEVIWGQFSNHRQPHI